MMNRTIIARLSPTIVDLILSLKKESAMDLEEVIGTLWLLSECVSRDLRQHPRYKELILAPSTINSDSIEVEK